MKKFALLILLMIPFYLSAQTDNATLSARDKITISENGGIYFFDMNKIITGSADKELTNYTNSMLKKIGKFSKKNKSKVTLIFITNLSENEYKNLNCTDAEFAFNFARKKLGAGISTMMIYGSMDAYGLLKVRIE